MTVIKHDGFARHEIVRECIEPYDMYKEHTCSWCGQKPEKHRLFKYGISPDDSNRVSWAKGEFCGIGCFQVYHDEA